jgi:hypothetical protein
MEQHAGIDVSLKLSSVCIVDASGQIVKETKVASEPEAFPVIDAAITRGCPVRADHRDAAAEMKRGQEQERERGWCTTVLSAAGKA